MDELGDEPLDEDPDGSRSDGAPANQYLVLPPRVPLEATVGEVDTSTPPDDPTTDPNRDVANRWGAGLAGF